MEIFLYGNISGQQYRVMLRLFSDSGLIDDSFQYTGGLWTSASLITFLIPLTSDLTLPKGDRIHISITNTTRRNNRPIYIVPVSGTEYSRTVIPALTVINVDQVVFYDAPYSGGSVITSAAPGQTVSIRAQISDPFGSFDIFSATLDFARPDGTFISKR